MEEASFIPILLRGTGRAALVVGAGPVGLRKARALAAGGFAVTVLAPSAAGLPDGTTYLQGLYPEDAPPLEPFCVVVAATNDRGVNGALAAAARQARCLVNVADDPDDSDFYTMAKVRDPATGALIAISTEGRDPALTRRLRERLEAWLKNEAGG